MPCTAEQPVAMANRSRRRGNRRGAGAADRLEAGVPQPVHRLPLVVHAIVQLAQRGRRGSGARRHIGAEPGQRRRFLRGSTRARGPSRRECRAARRPARDRGAIRRPRHRSRRAGAELFDEQRLDVSGENAARRQLVAIPRLGQERLAPQPFGGVLDRLFERQVLERVQRVVVDEDADGALRRQQVRQVVDHARQGMVRRAGVACGIVEHRSLRV